MDICTLVAVDGEVPVAQMEPAELPKIRYHTYTHFHTHIHSTPRLGCTRAGNP